MVCCVGTGPDDIRAEMLVPTAAPPETLARAVAFFREQPARVAAVGIASFGPVDLRRDSPTFGYITTTPKPGWAHTDVARPFRAGLGVPVAFDTDVNGAALAEHHWGAGRAADPLVYVTVGTGIGGGAVVNGRLLHGLMHPEMGHMRLPHDRSTDAFTGSCPYHGDCLDGLASGRALGERWGMSADVLPPGHAGWVLEAEYLALGLTAIIGVLSPQRIVLGGGVMRQPGLLEAVRHRVRALLNGYVPPLDGALDRYIVAPALGDRAGVLGALALAQATLARAE